MTRGVKIALIAMPVLLVGAAAGANTLMRVHGSLAQQRQDISAQWTDVDQAMRRRGETIAAMAAEAGKLAPLSDGVRNDIAHARAILDSSASPQEKMQANDKLSNAVARLMVEGDEHPTVSSNASFLSAQDEVRKSDDRVAEARLKYNDSLEHYNARIQSFPHNLVARIAGFERNDAYFPTEHF
jgi:LemA protein